MPCSEWENLLEAYRIATRVYDHAVAALTSRTGAEFNQAWAQSETARKNCGHTRAELLHHEHQHKCIPRPEAALRASTHELNTDDLILGDQGQSGG
jgi:hypothetical protein